MAYTTVANAPRIGVVQFPGTNCGRETELAITRAGMRPVPFLWNEDRGLLRSLDGYVLAGGFSYEDRSRSGIIAALDPVMTAILRENEQGKPVLGICNGAQMLVESGLVPGVALTTNRRVLAGRILGTGFYNAWVTLRRETIDPSSTGVFTGDLQAGELIRVPAAHAEGRFVLTAEALRLVEEKGLVAFRYTDAAGVPLPEFPVNPNGSTANIAALTNEAGTAMAIMPHPERTAAGDGIFRSLRAYLVTHGHADARFRSHSRGEPYSVAPPSSPAPPATPRPATPPPPPPEPMPVYQPYPDTEQVVVELIITDNAAVSVENALNRRGIPVSIRRRVHWELRLREELSPEEREELLRRVHGTGELYNENKERLTAAPSGSGREGPSFTLLVRERDDVIGPRTQQALQDWFGCRGIESLRRGVLWTIRPADEATHAGPVDLAGRVEAVLATTILMNPVSQEGFQYV